MDQNVNARVLRVQPFALFDSVPVTAVVVVDRRRRRRRRRRRKTENDKEMY